MLCLLYDQITVVQVTAFLNCKEPCFWNAGLATVKDGGDVYRPREVKPDWAPKNNSSSNPSDSGANG